MRRRLILKTIVVLTIVNSCVTNDSKQINGIWLLKNTTWYNSKTGIIEIDTTRVEANTELLVLYNNQLIHGNISLYQYSQEDTILIVFEAGQMSITLNDCMKVKEFIPGKSISTNEVLIPFREQKTAIYGEKVFLQTDFSTNDKSALIELLEEFCR